MLKGSAYFCRERLEDPADDLSAVLERLGQPFQDLVAAYRFTGAHQELLDHSLTFCWIITNQDAKAMVQQFLMGARKPVCGHQVLKRSAQSL